MGTNEDVRHLRSDESGAIMVMGIFMCTCLVGALWYLAGIGDAILLRERAQEAADAVAFADAALHARGMNLIVLVNVIMACILGIRVALKIAKLVLTIAAAVFSGLGFLCPAFWALAAPCATGAEILEQAINATRAPINAALEALSVSEDAISTATPSAARAGAQLMVGDRYAPRIARVGVAHFGSDTSLPVEDGSQDKLCKEAGRSVGYFLGWVLEKAGLGSVGGEPEKWLGDKFAWLASTSPQQFCEMGSETGDTDTSSLFDEPAKEQCENEPDSSRKSFEASEKNWEASCASSGVTCTGMDANGQPIAQGTQQGHTTPAQQATLDRLRLVRDQDARSNKELSQKFSHGVGLLERPRCEAWARDDMQRRMSEQQKMSTSASAANGAGAQSGAKPKKVEGSFRNGHREAQVAGGASFDGALLVRSARLVEVGSWGGSKQVRAPESPPSWAQAEFFYDCPDTWSRCNDDEEAMWHLKWRARLRRWNEPSPLSEALSKMGFIGSGVDLAAFTTEAKSMRRGLAPNATLDAELERALDETRERGVH